MIVKPINFRIFRLPLSKLQTRDTTPDIHPDTCTSHAFPHPRFTANLNQIQHGRHDQDDHRHAA
jgi:hypothetical protein